MHNSERKEINQYTEAAMLRGAALDNDAMFEARAEAACSMGVGCGSAGVCYAERMGRPEMCGRRSVLSDDEEAIR